MRNITPSKDSYCSACGPSSKCTTIIESKAEWPRNNAVSGHLSDKGMYGWNYITYSVGRDEHGTFLPGETTIWSNKRRVVR